MRVGMTGARAGGTATQLEAFEALLEGLGATELHHGDCVGADAQAHEIAIKLGIPVIVHPPDNSTHRAWSEGGYVLGGKPYLERNRDIVDACDTLIAIPDKPETLRSGTWATVRYARTVGRSIIILDPEELL
jgi:hypothetical protein